MSETKHNFVGGIYSYDIHTYWAQTDPQQKEIAFKLREKLQQDFKQEIENGDIRVFKFWEQPIGPHPLPMWECDFKKPEIFVKLVPWYQMNHQGLSVLIHPRSDEGALRDHTHNALWLGHKQRLIAHILENDD